MQNKQGFSTLDPDPDFTNLAWHEMSAMLDEEMPLVVEQPLAGSRKHYVLLLLLLIGFGSGLTYFMTTPSAENEKHPELNQPMAQGNDPGKNIASAPADFSTATTPAAQVNDEVANNSGENIKILNKNQSAFVYKNSPESENQSDITTGLKTGQPELHPDMEGSELTEMFTAREVLLTSSVNSNSHVDQPKNKDVFEKIKLSESKVEAAVEARIAPFDQLVPLSLLNGKLKKERLPNLEKPMKKSFFSKLIPDRYGITAGLFSSNFKYYTSYQAGIGIAYDLGPKVQLRTGLNYQRYQKSITYAYAENVNDIANSDPFNPGYNITHEGPFTESMYFDPENGSVENLIIKTKYYQLNRLGYIGVPFIVSLKPSHFWSVNLGTQFSMLINNEGMALSEGVDIIEEEIFADKLLENGLQKINASIISGLSFYPHKNIGINFNYNFAFSNLIKEDILRVTNGNNSNNNFEVSVNWYLFNR